MQRCPFCGQPESERFTIESRLYIVFPCMFTARVSPGQPEDQLAREIEVRYGGDGAPYLRRTCDVLHVYVTKGAGASVLTGAGEEPRPLKRPGPTRAANVPPRDDAGAR